MTEPYTIDVSWSDEDEGFIATVRELDGCSAWGKTRDEALREIETAIELWVGTAKKIGR